jgi:sterol desaturase/sphingolipid hydroxylase (fatty acid hydroxylase superfamily)
MNKRHPRTGRLMPRQAQVLTWQLSAVFLTLSVLAMLGGMFILIWSSTGSNLPGTTWWNTDAKLAVTFSIVAFVIFLLFVFEQVTLYSWSGRDDSTQYESTHR